MAANEHPADSGRGTGDVAAGGAIRSSARNTLRAYHSDWRKFCDWARCHGRETLPAEPVTICLYLQDLAGAAKASTIARSLASIGHIHRSAAWPSPTDNPCVRALWAEIRGRAPILADPAAEPIDVSLLRRMLERLPGGLSGLRDRALLLVGFSGALRRSQLVAIDLDHLVAEPGGLVITPARDQPEGILNRLSIPRRSDPALCPVRAVDVWCNEAELSTGPLFRAVDRHGRVGAGRLSAAGASRIVQRAVARAGIDARGFSAESLRARSHGGRRRRPS